MKDRDLERRFEIAGRLAQQKRFASRTEGFYRKMLNLIKVKISPGSSMSGRLDDQADKNLHQPVKFSHVKFSEHSIAYCSVVHTVLMEFLNEFCVV